MRPSNVGAHATTLSKQRLRQLLQQTVSDMESCRVIRSKRGKTIQRLTTSANGTIILKMWNRPGPRQTIRRLTRTSNALREYRALRLLRRHSLSVPTPLGYCRVRNPIVPYHEALFLEDLGPCVLASEHLEKLIREGSVSSVDDFEADIISITCGMVRAGIFDLDHSMNNIVVTSTGSVVRVDLERAKRYRLVKTQHQAYAQMLARLIGTYTFAVQPDTDRVRDFSARLVDALSPGQRVLRKTAGVLESMLEAQRHVRGVDTRLLLPW